MEFKKIDAAFDGSDYSVKAVEAAADIAVKFKAELVVVHVYARPVWTYATYGVAPPPNMAELQNAARDAAQGILDRGLQTAILRGAKPRGDLIESPSVVQALVEFAADGKADIVVVGSRGMTRFKRLILGSVSSGLVTHAGCPVLVVR